MYKSKEIENSEALSKVNYINAIKFFNSRQIPGEDAQAPIDRFVVKIRDYLSWIEQ
jgi:hypothetical protein